MLSPLQRIQTLYEAYNSSKSEVLIGIGSHRSETNKPLTIGKPTSSEVKFNMPWGKIFLDLNSLPCNKSNTSDGCKLDVHLTVRHRPGCTNLKDGDHQVSSGSGTINCMGKGTYAYKQKIDEEVSEKVIEDNDEYFDDGYNTVDYYEDCHFLEKRCDELTARCEKLLSEFCKKEKEEEEFTNCETSGKIQICQRVDRVALIQTCNENESPKEFLRKKEFWKNEEGSYI